MKLRMIIAKRLAFSCASLEIEYFDFSMLKITRKNKTYRFNLFSSPIFEFFFSQQINFNVYSFTSVSKTDASFERIMRASEREKERANERTSGGNYWVAVGSGHCSC